MTISHPKWCDPAFCRAEDWVEHHRGTPMTVAPVAGSGVQIRLQLTALGWEPVEDATVRIEAVLSRVDLGSVETFYFDHRTGARLQDALGRLPAVIAERRAA
jgi:hypothetical protein